MANLETLFIEIDGSAAKAKGGIDNLIGSLSALGQKVESQLAPLREFSALLKDIKANSTFGNMGGIGSSVSEGTTSRVKKATKAVNDYAKAIKAVNFPTDANGNPIDAFGNAIDKSKPVILEDGTRARFANEQDILASSTKQATKAIVEENKALDNTAKVTDEAAKSTTVLSESTKMIGKASVNIKQTHRATSGLLSTIGRIAKTMLIRTAIRSVMKLAKQGLDNFYEYSKSIGSAYAAAIDSLNMKTSVAGNQIGAMLGSLLTAIYPILSAVITIVSAVAEAITMLFALLGGQTTYTKATSGFESIGKAAGGAGGKIKEMLASFDELNIIASESGGGGGGGGGSAFSFENLALPQWMMEWKPLIEALVAGTIGAIILPKIFDWLKKIFGLGTGDGASVIKKILELFTKTNNPDFKINGLDTALAELAGITAELTGIEEILKRIKSTGLPDFTGAAVQMGILAGAATLGAPAIVTIAEALDKLRKGIDLWDMLKTLISSLAGLLLGGTRTIKVQVDETELDKLKESLKKPVYINLALNTSEFNRSAGSLMSWLRQNDSKVYYVKFDEKALQTFINQANAIHAWVISTLTKVVKVVMDPESYKTFINTANTIHSWTISTITKNVKIAFVEAQLKYFLEVANTIESWANRSVTKAVGVAFNTVQLLAFAAYSSAIDSWANTKVEKVITVKTNYDLWSAIKAKIEDWLVNAIEKVIKVKIDALSYAAYTATALLIDTWIMSVGTKVIKVSFDKNALNSFTKDAQAINTWVAAVATKAVRVGFSTDSVSSFVKDIQFINTWTSALASKVIRVMFDADAYMAFVDVVNSIEAWAAETLTKRIVIETVEKGTSGSSGSTASNISNISSAVATAAASVNAATALAKAYQNSNANALYNFTKNASNGPVLVSFFGEDISGSSGGHNYAAGGFPDTGDIFIANEQGAELVGSLNGKTAVANQDQIVEGIKNGVYEAQSEQNKILMEQNTLLRGILEKETTVRFGSSASFGRTVKQSLDMYTGLVGG